MFCPGPLCVFADKYKKWLNGTDRSIEYYGVRNAAGILNCDGKAVLSRMKTMDIGLGMVGGMALAVTAVNALYPDVWRRMKRDGKRAARTLRRSSLLK